VPNLEIADPLENQQFVQWDTLNQNVSVPSMMKRFQLRLWMLFALTAVVAGEVWLYARARDRVSGIDALYAMGCPVVYSRGDSEELLKGLCMEFAWGPDENEVKWTGWLPALSGSWETSSFTALFPAEAVGHPDEEDKLISRLKRLYGLQMVVLCVGENEEFASSPAMRQLILKLQQALPGLKVIVQRHVLVG
jgi:hypothetical protein